MRADSEHVQRSERLVRAAFKGSRIKFIGIQPLRHGRGSAKDDAQGGAGVFLRNVGVFVADLDIFLRDPMPYMTSACQKQSCDIVARLDYVNGSTSHDECGRLSPAFCLCSRTRSTPITSWTIQTCSIEFSWLPSSVRNSVSHSSYLGSFRQVRSISRMETRGKSLG